MPRTLDPSQLLPGGGVPSEPRPLPLQVHVTPTSRAHGAGDIALGDPYGRFSGARAVEDALGQLAALVPPAAPEVGSEGVAWLGSSNTGVPDWGCLKLAHGALPFTGNSAADPRTVYPYYYRAPAGPGGVGLTGTGLDPVTDPVFNVADGTYTGGGPGQAHAGAATVSRTNPAGTLATPSWRLLPGLASEFFVVSGICSPADRGVLALVAWVPGNTSAPVAAVSANEVLARCPAAILLGAGLRSGSQDGAPGGIFTESSGPTRAQGSVDFTGNPAAPYTLTVDCAALGLSGPTSYVFSSLAAGPAGTQQFVRGASATDTALAFATAVNAVLYPRYLVAVPAAATVLIVVSPAGTAGNGVTVTTAAALTVTPVGGAVATAPSPYGFPGRASGQFDLAELHTGFTSGAALPFVDPTAGQVRLLTDPGAFGGLVANGGLPILGGTQYARGTNSPEYLPVGLGGGVEGNFFAYRLPYLADYNPTTGLVYTPSAERGRYLTRYLPAASPGTPLPTAGNYDDYRADYWGYQVARYRHRQALTAVTMGSLRKFGSWALVHFKTEHAFERYVRDGVAPAASALYSVNMVTWSGAVQGTNLVTATTPPVQSAAIPVSRAEIISDPNGDDAPLTSGTFTSLNLGHVTQVSGVSYYVPRDPTHATNANLGLSAFNVSITGLFDGTYYTHDRIPSGGPLVADARRYALNANPAFLSLASFSRGGTEAGSGLTLNVGGMSLFAAQLGEVRRARIELGYADLTTAATLDPAVAAAVAWVPTPGTTPTNSVNFAGDEAPTFTTDAKVRLFIRRPLALHGGLGYPLPTVTALTLVNTSGDRILYHGMRETSAGGETVPYGNPATTSKAVRNATKDTEERFLDEIYRYPTNWAPIVDGRLGKLQGPGLPGGAGSIPVPVRPVSGGDYTGWYLQSLHASPLPAGELQVGGWPARNPPYTDGVTEPLPSLGLLMYPQDDYSSDDPVGPNYGAYAGTRAYVRAFDAGILNAGRTRVLLRIWGVDWTDFVYTAPGPGTPGMALMVKVPGLTTWMDAGRATGAGPSRQDAASDGAGCAVIGSTTFSATDTTTQLRYTQVEVELGAGGELFANGEGKCPVLVKVILKDHATARALNLENVSEHASNAGMRGIVKITISAA